MFQFISMLKLKPCVFIVICVSLVVQISALFLGEFYLWIFNFVFTSSFWIEVIVGSFEDLGLMCNFEELKSWQIKKKGFQKL